MSDATSAGALIDLCQVSRTYPGPPPVPALHPVSLQIRSGEFVTIAGPSGSGKSTLLNVLGLLDQPSTGTYLLEGHDVGQFSQRIRSRIRGQRIGFVFQTFELLPHRPALDSVTLPLMYQGMIRRQQLEVAMRALERVGVAHKATSVASRLSGGERQRVAIARAICGSPALLLCDEPTGNLDSKNAADVLGLLGDLNASGATVVVITHNPDVAALGTTRLQIVDGHVT